MPWTKDNYPNAMKNLEEKTRNKAIEISNSLLDDDYDEPRAIVVAISQAREWASRRKIFKSKDMGKKEEVKVVVHKKMDR